MHFDGWIYDSEHTFVVWGFSRSHALLLLRGGTEEERVDLLFSGVAAVNIPLQLLGIRVARVDERYAISTGGDSWWIEARDCQIHLAVAPPDAPSAVFGRERSVGDCDYVPPRLQPAPSRGEIREQLTRLLRGWREGFVGPRFVMEECERLERLFDRSDDSDPLALCVRELSILHLQLYLPEDAHVFIQLLNNTSDTATQLREWDRFVDSLDLNARQQRLRCHPFYVVGNMASGPE